MKEVASILVIVAMCNHLLATSRAHSLSCSSELRCLCFKNSKELLVANCSGVGLSVVPTFNSSVRIIDLSMNKLSTLHQNGAIPSTIVRLNLSGNRLQSLGDETFRGMMYLRELDLSRNKLRYSSLVFKNDIFKDLKQLHHLNIKHNAKISEDSYPRSISQLSSVRFLMIDGLENSQFGKEIHNLNKLQFLDFSGYSGKCNLLGLKSEFFGHLPRIKYINVSKCNITFIETGTFWNLTTLNTLNLSQNTRLTFRVLSNLSHDIQYTNIKELFLNKIHCSTGIGTIIFAKDIMNLANSSIQRLHIDSNRLEMFQSGSTKYLPLHLKFLSLADNKIALQKYLLQTSTLQNLEELVIGYQYSPHGLLPDTYVECNDWRGPDATSEITVPDQNEKSIQQFNFFPLPPKLRIIDFRYSSLKFKISEFVFSERNSLTHIHFQHNSFTDFIGPLHNLNHLTYLDISYNQCRNLSTFFFDYIFNLEVLNISNNNLGYVLKDDTDGQTFKNLKNLSYLDVSNNQIRFLPRTIFRNLSKTITLKIANNFLTEWSIQIDHMKKLEYLDISFNQISNLGKEDRDFIEYLRESNNFTINMTGNTMQCTCQSLEFVQWLNNHREVFVNFDQYQCILYNGSLIYMNNLPSVLGVIERHCHPYIGLIIGVSIAVVLSMSFVICGLIYRYRWKLRYLYYATKTKYRRHPGYYHGADEKKYEYDAFISYADEDKSFVTETILEKIEVGAGLNLFLHQRDFIAGNAIAENITNAIRNSRKTVVILTRNYLKSYWCMYEFNMARMENIYNRTEDNILFLVLYEKIPVRDIPLVLLDLIETKSYLEYPDDDQGQIVFWDNLRSAIVCV